MTDHATWTPAHIGIGSNLSDPKQQVTQGFAALAQLPDSQLVARSRLYRSSPLGPQDQPPYINAVAGMLTQLDAPTLLAHLKRLEAEQGREQPIVRWGPRVIDFDLLVFGNLKLDTNTLKLPHPGVATRNFVLYPLADIAPDLEVPGVGRVTQLQARVDRADLGALT
jgi:2-amino-4-hydroxy-6-hydroxymethyldihydropteridine diphosphokinase